MKRFEPRRHMIDFLFALALFGVFSVTALLVVLIGARVYQRTVDGMDINFERRTSLSYVATKIRQLDRASAIRISEVGGTPVLMLDQEANDTLYHTIIYHEDGALRELSYRDEMTPDLQSGSIVMDVRDFSFDQAEEGLILLTATDRNGNPAQLYVAVQCD